MFLALLLCVSRAKNNKSIKMDAHQLINIARYFWSVGEGAEVRWWEVEMRISMGETTICVKNVLPRFASLLTIFKRHWRVSDPRILLFVTLAHLQYHKWIQEELLSPRVKMIIIHHRSRSADDGSDKAEYLSTWQSESSPFRVCWLSWSCNSAAFSYRYFHLIYSCHAFWVRK